MTTPDPNADRLPMPPAEFLAAITMVGERAAAGYGWQEGYLAGRAAILDDAREVVRRLVHMEREQLGSGPEGHLSERDLAPLLHALHIDPEETP